MSKFTDVSQRGTNAARPAANAVPTGTLYYDTTNSQMTRSNGSTWDVVEGGAGASFATPAIVLGTAAAAGAAGTVIRSDSTIVAFDATAPVTQAYSDSAATGSATVAARRDHKHGMPAASGNATYNNALASPPSSPASGDLWLPSDSYYTARYNGSAWEYRYEGFPVTLPVDGNYAWVNQNGATVSTTHGGILLDAVTTAATQYKIRKKGRPSTPPWSVTCGFLPAPGFTNGNGMAFLVRESGTGKLTTWQVDTDGATVRFGVFNWNSATSFNAAVVNDGTYWSSFDKPVWLRIKDDNTNLLYQVSRDGYNFYTWATQGRTAFLAGGADEVGFGVRQEGTFCATTLISWLEA